MQTFVPFVDFNESAKCLDETRLSKQVTEIYQLERLYIAGKLRNSEQAKSIAAKNMYVDCDTPGTDGYGLRQSLIERLASYETPPHNDTETIRLSEFVPAFLYQLWENYNNIAKKEMPVVSIPYLYSLHGHEKHPAYLMWRDYMATQVHFGIVCAYWATRLYDRPVTTAIKIMSLIRLYHIFFQPGTVVQTICNLIDVAALNQLESHLGAGSISFTKTHSFCLRLNPVSNKTPEAKVEALRLIEAYLERVNYDAIPMPPWIGNEDFHKTHRGSLWTKNQVFYQQFKEDGLSFEDYIWPVTKDTYVVDYDRNSR